MGSQFQVQFENQVTCQRCTLACNEAAWQARDPGRVIDSVKPPIQRRGGQPASHCLRSGGRCRLSLSEARAPTKPAESDSDRVGRPSGSELPCTLTGSGWRKRRYYYAYATGPGMFVR